MKGLLSQALWEIPASQNSKCTLGERLPWQHMGQQQVIVLSPQRFHVAFSSHTQKLVTRCLLWTEANSLFNCIGAINPESKCAANLIHKQNWTVIQKTLRAQSRTMGKVIKIGTLQSWWKCTWDIFLKIFKFYKPREISFETHGNMGSIFILKNQPRHFKLFSIWGSVYVSSYKHTWSCTCISSSYSLLSPIFISALFLFKKLCERKN